MANEDQKVAATQANPMAGVATLLQALGGTKTTTSAGNVDVLNQAVAGLQGQDPQAMLQAIFQQASGQIPGIQAAYGRATGARSSGNSAVQNALNALLQQTTIAAQDKIANQQIANLGQQVQAGGAIASATKGTTQKTGTDLGQSAKMLAVLQLLSKSGLFGKDADVLGGMGKALGISGGTASTPAAQASASSVTPAPAPQMSTATPGFDPAAYLTQALQQSVQEQPALVSAPDQMSMAPIEMFTPTLDINSLISDQPAPEMSMAPGMGIDLEWLLGNK